MRLTFDRKIVPKAYVTTQISTNIIPVGQLSSRYNITITFQSPPLDAVNAFFNTHQNKKLTTLMIEIDEGLYFIKSDEKVVIFVGQRLHNSSCGLCFELSLM